MESIDLLVVARLLEYAKRIQDQFRHAVTSGQVTI
jgi:hypothetical protein|tara:strand:+ start:129 stop:233 length:105 start_codon:yes stop_codon:yes gene_type:complete